MRDVTIELPSPGITTLRAVKHLLRDQRLNASVRVTSAPRHAPGPGVLRIESASVVRPVVTVLWGDELTRELSPSDLEVALSREIWADAASPEPWRMTAEPLLELARIGAPDRERPWVLVAPGVTTAAQYVEQVTGLQEPQLHFLGTGAADGTRAAVRWLPRRKVVRALLGQVDAVIAPTGPLAWDALRAGVPVFTPESAGGVPWELAMCRLKRTVPAVLINDGAFWRKLAADLLRGADDARWGTVAWVLHARERAAPQPAVPLLGFKLTTVKRKFRKLKRDPAAFWADSSVARLYRGASALGADLRRSYLRPPHSHASSNAQGRDERHDE